LLPLALWTSYEFSPRQYIGNLSFAPFADRSVLLRIHFHAQYAGQFQIQQCEVP